MMFYRTGYDVPALIAKSTGCAEDRKVVAFRSAAGEDNFCRLATPDLRDAITGVVKQRASLTANVMDAGWITVNVAEVREHRLTHLWIEGRGRVVVEIDARHNESVGRFQGETILRFGQERDGRARCPLTLRSFPRVSNETAR